MINFDSLTLKLFAQENTDFFTGAKIQKIQQPNRSELIFHIRNLGQSKKFYINFNPNFAHICFMSEENEKRRNISIPKTAPMFCMLLRKYIQNARLVKIDVPKNERIFEMYFEYFDELNEKSLLCLAIELMGKHSNVILYNYDTNVIIGCAHNVSSEKSRERELAGLLPYIYPPKQKKRDILRVSFENFNSDSDLEIVQNLNYLTIPLLNQIKQKYSVKTKTDLYNILREFLSKKSYNYYIKNNISEFSLIDIEDSFECKTINEMIDKYFSYHQNLFIKENLRSKVTRNIGGQLKKLYSLREKQNIQLKKIDKAIIYKQKADIIMANAYYIKQGLNVVDLYDFDGNEIKIDLDENLTPVDNANRYYQLYKKSKAANEHASLLLEETNSQILFYEELNFYTKNAETVAELQEIWAEINNEFVVEKEIQQKVDFVEFQGFKIYIGKNKKQNDYILSKISSSEDLWFHPLNAAGSHVLVKKNNSKEIVPDNVLLKAAQITKEYSSQKDNSKTSIIYTMRKYVKKANNKLAFVTYKNEIEIVV